MRAAILLSLAACGRLGFDELVADAPPDTAPACASTFITVMDAPLKYRFEPTPTPWPMARDACAAFGPGHALAVPKDDAERIAISAKARATVVDRWWLGGTDAATEGTWLDTAGNAITFQPWASGEPNNTGGNENCLDILADPVEGSARVDRFDDRACDALYPFICACSL